MNSKTGENGEGATPEPQWHYALKGNRLGPIPQSQLVKMVETGKLDANTEVWKHGMDEWATIKRLGLARAVNLGPPPIGADHVKNGYVWLVAFAPVIFALINIYIRLSVMSDCETDPGAAHCQSFLLDPSKYHTPWILVGIANGALCLLDERRLAKAGYSRDYLIALALVLPPLYLFARARRLKQTPWYGLAWIGSALLSLAL